jgi:mono/diheme cytochrome c family protein
MRQLLSAAFLTLAAAPLLAQDQAGAGLYATHCVACHQVEAVGAPGIAPPLAGNIGRHASSEAGRAYLARVPLTGMVGTINVGGVRYTGNMPSFAKLTDGEIANVVAYLLATYEGIGDLAWLTPEFVATIRQAGGTPNETHKLRGRLPAASGG